MPNVEVELVLTRARQQQMESRIHNVRWRRCSRTCDSGPPPPLTPPPERPMCVWQRVYNNVVYVVRLWVVADGWVGIQQMRF